MRKGRVPLCAAVKAVFETQLERRFLRACTYVMLYVQENEHMGFIRTSLMQIV